METLHLMFSQIMSQRGCPESRRPRRRAENGFTLVEVVVATAVFAMVAGAIISALIINQYSVQAARNRIVAFNLITSQLENIGTWSAPSMQSMVNGAGGITNIVDTIPTVSIADPVFASGFQSRTTTIASTQNFYMVTVQINWTEKALGGYRSMSDSATTYVLPTQ